MADANTTPAAPAAATFDFRGLVERAKADNPDVTLFDAIEEDKASSRRFKKALDGLRGTRGHERGDTIHRLACETIAVRDRIAAARPVTLDGLLAKLRHAARHAHRAPGFSVQNAAMLDAIAWLEPPKPKRGRPAAKRAGGAL